MAIIPVNQANFGPKKELAKARQVVVELERERQETGEQGESTRREQARKGAAEWENIRENKQTETDFPYT